MIFSLFKGMYKRLFFLFLTVQLLFSVTSFAQTLSGHVQDAVSGEQLLGATVWCEDTKQGVAANIYGFYSLTLPEGKHNIIVTYIGYTPQRFEIDLSMNIKMDINLIAGTKLKEAVVSAESLNKIEEQVQMSKMEIPIDQVKRLPAIGGEVDLLKVLQLLPGVQSGGEGTSGLYVRGGSPDQNLMLLDGVPLYSVNHLFGFFSVFNADAVKNMSITKGGFPARFGGRLSSILEIYMKDGHMKEYHADATVSIIASKLTVEGPIVEDKASFMLSARRTYLDLLIKPLISQANSNNPDVTTDPRYYFYDLNGKLNWRIGPKDRLYLSAFKGEDDFGIASAENYGINSSTLDFGLDWKNEIQALRWNREWSPRLFSNTTLTRSLYNFNTGIEITEQSEDTLSMAALYNSGIEDFSGRIDFDFAPNARHYIKFGANWTNHTFSPGATSLELNFGDTPALDTLLGPADIKSDEAFLYVEDEFELSERLKLNLGVHASILMVQDTSYNSIQPRAALNYRLPGGYAFKASFARMAQYVNLLTNEGLGLPTDLWVPSTARIRPQQSWQVAMGVAKTFGDIEVSLEGYYKGMEGLLSYKEGASFLFSLDTDWEDQVTQGIGNAYGTELLVQKKYGRTTGWIGYTLSWSNRKFDDINSGNWYPYTYDRRHDMSFVVTHDFTDKWTGSAVWLYGTGRALTLSESSFSAYIPDGTGEGIYTFSAEVPSEKNAFRMSPYHRLDLSLTRTKFLENGTRHLIFSVYNAYNNLNPFFAQTDEDDNGNPVIREYGIFPIIPSVAWRFSF
ncbi:MAG: TonB-dependent receptor [Bacteroidetes bacterium]|nr:TonB-dependent receptor [Bacteroidota bacterium]MDA0980769.1 TonB-dependent receptor [Bacteroidota bacterium]